MLSAISLLLVSYLYLFLLGSSALSLWHSIGMTPVLKSEDRALVHSALVCSGLCLHHVLILLAPTLSDGMIVTGVLAIVGCMVLWRSPVRKVLLQWPFSLGTSLLLAFFFFVFVWHLIAVPNTGWDARSIWFFHAKGIYFEDSIRVPDLWKDPAYAWSHVDYPKLIAEVAAVVAKVFGYWNDFLPRLGLAIVLLPALLCLASLPHRSFASAVLFFGLFGSKPMEYLSGYADGPLAVYSCLTLIVICLARGENNPLRLWQAVACLGILLQIKKEGAIVAIVLVAVFGLACALKIRSLVSVKALSAVLILISGFIVWNAFCLSWGLGKIEPFPGPGFWLRVGRAPSETLRVLFVAFGQHEMGKFFLTALGIAWFCRRSRGGIPWLAIFAVPSIYLVVLMTLYLGTPYDLQWQLDTSLARTLLVPKAFLIAAMYLALSVAKKTPFLPRWAQDRFPSA